MPLLAPPPALPASPKGVFIAGTDTGIGKTLVSALLVKSWHGFYWKPLQTGLAEETGDSETVTSLAGLSPSRLFPPAYGLQAPLSPMAAAEFENIIIDRNRLTLPTLPESPAPVPPLIVEGAGGLMVPICDDMLMIDLIAALHLPVILVTRGELGTINHTLLSLEALYSRNIPVLGFVINGRAAAENQEIIEESGKSRCLFTIPHSSLLAESPPTERLITMIGWESLIPSWETLARS